MVDAESIILGDAEEEISKLSKESIAMIYIDPPFFTNKSFVKNNNYGVVSFHDVWNGGISEYMLRIKSLARECKRVLKDTGSIYVHCDWHASHYIKVALDEIFGYKNFRNEIVWRRHNSHNDAKTGHKNFGKCFTT